MPRQEYFLALPLITVQFLVPVNSQSFHGNAIPGDDFLLHRRGVANGGAFPTCTGGGVWRGALGGRCMRAYGFVRDISRCGVHPRDCYGTDVL